MTNVAAPTIEYVTSIPEPARSAKSGGGSVYSKLMREMDGPKAGKKKGDPVSYASFFVAASVPDTITDATERQKAAKEASRKLANQFSSIVRRIQKETPTKAFAFRTVQDGNGAWGLRVYRIEDTEPKAEPASTPVAAPPPPPPAS